MDRLEETSNGISRLVLAKQKRKEAAHDLQLLKNRIALLKAEEEKAWKKIEETKEKANELLKIRKEHKKKLIDKKEHQIEIEKNLQFIQKQHRDFSTSIELVKKNDMMEKLDLKRSSVKQLKKEKQKWRETIEITKQKQIEEALKKKKNVLKHEEHVKIIKEKKKAEIEKLKKERAIEKIKEEEKDVNDKIEQVKEMEKIEFELINRLKNTQLIQKKAYEELENALGVDPFTDPLTPRIKNN